ncbi:hypothetical protein D3C73_1287260 [compost metagenome]
MQMGDDQRIDVKQGVDVNGQLHGRIADLCARRSDKTRIRTFRGQHWINEEGLAAKGDVQCGITDLRDVHGVCSTCWVSGVILECCPEDECGQMGD